MLKRIITKLKNKRFLAAVVTIVVAIGAGLGFELDAGQITGIAVAGVAIVEGLFFVPTKKKE